MMWNDGAGWSSWALMGLGMVVLWGALIFALVAILRGSRGQARDAAASQPDHDPETILQDRFARGDIDADEYHVRQSVLRGLR